MKLYIISNGWNKRNYDTLQLNLQEHKVCWDLIKLAMAHLQEAIKQHKFENTSKLCQKHGKVKRLKMQPQLLRISILPINKFDIP